MWLVREWLAWFSPRRWRYSRQHAAHVVRVTEAEGLCPSPDGWRCDGCYDVDGPGGGCSRAAGRADYYGSMNLDDEREFLTTVPGTRMTIWAPSGEVEFSEEPPFLAAPEVAHSGWWGQTAADLAPEALALDSGPGGCSELLPGPDQAPIREDAQGRAARVCASESRPAARADLTGSLSSRPHQEDPGSAAHAEPGPDTARLAWLDRQLASHADWARRMRGQVTGWGLEAAA